MTVTGTLYLIPTNLAASEVSAVLPPATVSAVHRLATFVVENPKTARAFLKAIGHPIALQAVRFLTLDEHTRPAAISALVSPLVSGTDVGLMSEAGCPGIADPGAPLVARAHEAGIRVVPLVGPSAVLLALMASVFNGQRFRFHGYLPVAASDRRQRLAELESAAWRDDTTQIFIEAPYRNAALFDAILATCRPDTRLCIATDLTSPEESVRALGIGQWRSQRPDLHRRPTVFLLYRGAY